MSEPSRQETTTSLSGWQKNAIDCRGFSSFSGIITRCLVDFILPLVHLSSKSAAFTTIVFGIGVAWIKLPAGDRTFIKYIIQKQKMC